MALFLLRRPLPSGKLPGEEDAQAGGASPFLGCKTNATEVSADHPSQLRWHASTVHTCRDSRASPSRHFCADAEEPIGRDALNRFFSFVSEYPWLTRLLPQTCEMPAVNAIVAREHVAQLAKRENWAKQEAGVVVVFCIVGVVAIGLLSLFIHKKLAARRAAKASF